MGKAKPAAQAGKTPLQKAWHFLWYEDSVASWVASIGLAFVLIKFVIYPVLGVALGTTFPVVAVVSESMEHTQSFDAWWAQQESLYAQFNITKSEFARFPMDGGFNKGDIILLVGAGPDKVAKGDVIVFWGGKAYPIIHRVVQVGTGKDGVRFFETKGDNNLGQIVEPPLLDERYVPMTRACSDDPSGRCQVVFGRAVLRIPYLGWVKIGFVDFLQWIGVPAA